jgi:hypothetical protein
MRNGTREGALDGDIIDLPLSGNRYSARLSDSTIAFSNGNLAKQEQTERVERIIDYICREYPIAKWTIIPIVYLSPDLRQEEWLGDFAERFHSAKKRYPRWYLRLLIALETGKLLLQGLKIKISDFFGKNE